jgi:hypothetical protein
MTLDCPNCGAAIPSSKINIRTMAAVCPTCDAVFSFDETALGYEKLKRDKIKKPEKFEVEETDNAVTIRYHVRRGTREWIGFFILCALLGSNLLRGGLNSESIILALIGGLILAAGLCTLFVLLTGFRMTVHVDHDALDITGGPVSWLESKQHIALDQIQRIYFDRIPHDKDSEPARQGDYYYMHVIEGSGKLRTMLEGLTGPEMSYIVRRIERFLEADADYSPADDAFPDEVEVGDDGELRPVQRGSSLS